MKKNRKKVFAAVLLLGVMVSVAIYQQGRGFQENKNVVLNDAEATHYTKELYAFLSENSGESILFGHQHATDEGVSLTNEWPRTGSTQSEVLNATGDYPAIFGWDTGSIDGNETPGQGEDVEQNIQNTLISMKKAHDLGAVLTLSTHPRNFVTGGMFRDTEGNVVKEILPGGSKHADFNQWLDQLADFAHRLRNEKGEAIPIIIRPFHEQNGDWFWWGAHVTDPESYKTLYRYTVDYLRNKKGVHHFIYAFSPNAEGNEDTEEYLKTYPGDEYGDILGIDSYDDKENAGGFEFLNGLTADLSMVVELAQEKGKVAALTEFGYSHVGMNQTGNTLDWYTKVLNAIKEDEKARQISYMLTWANFGWPDNMYVPYKDITGNLGGDHELLPDFQRFEQDAFTAFRNDIKGKVYMQE